MSPPLKVLLLIAIFIVVRLILKRMYNKHYMVTAEWVAQMNVKLEQWHELEGNVPKDFLSRRDKRRIIHSYVDWITRIFRTKGDFYTGVYDLFVEDVAYWAMPQYRIHLSAVIRHFSINPEQAAGIMDQLELLGIVEKSPNNKYYSVLVHDRYWMEIILNLSQVSSSPSFVHQIFMDNFKEIDRKVYNIARKFRN